MIVIPIVIALLAYCYYLETDAQRDAEAFCSAFEVGDPRSSIATTLAELPKPDLLNITDEQALALFIGIPPFSRYVCVIESADAIISTIEQSYVD